MDLSKEEEEGEKRRNPLSMATDGFDMHIIGADGILTAYCIFPFNQVSLKVQRSWLNYIPRTSRKYPKKAIRLPKKEDIC